MEVMRQHHRKRIDEDKLSQHEKRSEAKSRQQEFTGHRSSWVGKSYKVVHVKCDLGESFAGGSPASLFLPGTK